MTKVLELPDEVLKGKLYYGVSDDFFNYVSGDQWTAVLTDSGTAALEDAAGGTILLSPSDGTVADNDEAYLKLTKEAFKILDAKPIYFRARVKITEANTDDANVFAGLLDAIAANSLQDDGAGLDTSFSGAAFAKFDGDTNWHAIYSDGSTQTIVELTAANSLDGAAHPSTTATWFWLEIEINPVTSTKVDINFFIDGVLVYRMKDKTYANATETQPGFGVKNGSANHDKLTVDRVDCWAKR